MPYLSSGVMVARRWVVALLVCAAVLLAAPPSSPFCLAKRLTSEIGTTCSARSIVQTLVVDTDTYSSTRCGYQNVEVDMGDQPRSVLWRFKDALAVSVTLAGTYVNSEILYTGGRISRGLTFTNFSLANSSVIFRDVKLDYLLVDETAVREQSLVAFLGVTVGREQSMDLRRTLQNTPHLGQQSSTSTVVSGVSVAIVRSVVENSIVRFDRVSTQMSLAIGFGGHFRNSTFALVNSSFTSRRSLVISPAGSPQVTQFSDSSMVDLSNSSIGDVVMRIDSATVITGRSSPTQVDIRFMALGPLAFRTAPSLSRCAFGRLSVLRALEETPANGYITLKGFMRPPAPHVTEKGRCIVTIRDSQLSSHLSFINGTFSVISLSRLESHDVRPVQLVFNRSIFHWIDIEELPTASQLPVGGVARVGVDVILESSQSSREGITIRASRFDAGASLVFNNSLVTQCHFDNVTFSNASALEIHNTSFVGSGYLNAVPPNGLPTIEGRPGSQPLYVPSQVSLAFTRCRFEHFSRLCLHRASTAGAIFVDRHSTIANSSLLVDSTVVGKVAAISIGIQVNDAVVVGRNSVIALRNNTAPEIRLTTGEDVVLVSAGQFASRLFFEDYGWESPLRFDRLGSGCALDRPLRLEGPFGRTTFAPAQSQRSKVVSTGCHLQVSGSAYLGGVTVTGSHLHQLGILGIKSHPVPHVAVLDTWVQGRTALHDLGLTHTSHPSRMHLRNVTVDGPLELQNVDGNGTGAIVLEDVMARGIVHFDNVRLGQGFTVAFVRCELSDASTRVVEVSHSTARLAQLLPEGSQGSRYGPIDGPSSLVFTLCRLWAGAKLAFQHTRVASGVLLSFETTLHNATVFIGGGHFGGPFVVGVKRGDQKRHNAAGMAPVWGNTTFVFRDANMTRFTVSHALNGSVALDGSYSSAVGFEHAALDQFDLHDQSRGRCGPFNTTLAVGGSNPRVGGLIELSDISPSQGERGSSCSLEFHFVVVERRIFIANSVIQSLTVYGDTSAVQWSRGAAVIVAHSTLDALSLSHLARTGDGLILHVASSRVEKLVMSRLDLNRSIVAVVDSALSLITVDFVWMTEGHMVISNVSVAEEIHRLENVRDGTPRTVPRDWEVSTQAQVLADPISIAFIRANLQSSSICLFNVHATSIHVDFDSSSRTPRRGSVGESANVTWLIRSSNVSKELVLGHESRTFRVLLRSAVHLDGGSFGRVDITGVSTPPPPQVALTGGAQVEQTTIQNVVAVGRDAASSFGDETFSQATQVRRSDTDVPRSVMEQTAKRCPDDALALIPPVPTSATRQGINLAELVRVALTSTERALDAVRQVAVQAPVPVLPGSDEELAGCAALSRLTVATDAPAAAVATFTPSLSHPLTSSRTLSIQQEPPPPAAASPTHTVVERDPEDVPPPRTATRTVLRQSVPSDMPRSATVSPPGTTVTAEQQRDPPLPPPTPTRSLTTDAGPALPAAAVKTPATLTPRERTVVVAAAAGITGAAAVASGGSAGAAMDVQGLVVTMRGLGACLGHAAMAEAGDAAEAAVLPLDAGGGAAGKLLGIAALLAGFAGLHTAALLVARARGPKEAASTSAPASGVGGDRSADAAAAAAAAAPDSDAKAPAARVMYPRLTLRAVALAFQGVCVGGIRAAAAGHSAGFAALAAAVAYAAAGPLWLQRHRARLRYVPLGAVFAGRPAAARHLVLPHGYWVQDGLARRFGTLFGSLRPDALLGLPAVLCLRALLLAAAAEVEGLQCDARLGLVVGAYVATAAARVLQPQRVGLAHASGVASDMLMLVGVAAARLTPGTSPAPPDDGAPSGANSDPGQVEARSASTAAGAQDAALVLMSFANVVSMVGSIGAFVMWRRCKKRWKAEAVAHAAKSDADAPLLASVPQLPKEKEADQAPSGGPQNDRGHRHDHQDRDRHRHRARNPLGHHQRK